MGWTHNIKSSNTHFTHEASNGQLIIYSSCKPQSKIDLSFWITPSCSPTKLFSFLHAVNVDLQLDGSSGSVLNIFIRFSSLSIHSFLSLKTKTPVRLSIFLIIIFYFFFFREQICTHHLSHWCCHTDLFTVCRQNCSAHVENFAGWKFRTSS